MSTVTPVTVTLSSLLTPLTPQQIFGQLLAYYQANGFPVQSWQPGGTERTRLMAFSTVMASISAQYIPNLAAAGFLDYAGNISPQWLQLLAQEVYEVPYNAANFTFGTILLTSSAAAPAYTIAAGQLIAVFGASGNRYINTTGGTLSTNSTLSLTFQSETAAAKYQDPSSSGAITLVTPLPGVTLTNAPGNFTSTIHIGSGTAVFTPSTSLTPPGNFTVVVRVDSSGVTGVATWSYSISGAPFVSVGAVASHAIGVTPITVTFDTTSGKIMIIGDTYTFTTPGSWISQQGSDIESNASLVARCQARWASLSQIPVNNLYYLLATSTPTVGGQVTQCLVFVDSVINNKVNIVIAGPAGALPSATVSAVQSYINPRVPITDFPVVTSPITATVSLYAGITVSAAQSATAQAAILTAMENYIDGGLINATIRIAAIIDLIMNVPGVIDVTGVGIGINGGGPSSSNVQLGSSTSYVVGQLVVTNSAIAGFTYVLQ